MTPHPPANPSFGNDGIRYGYRHVRVVILLLAVLGSAVAAANEPAEAAIGFLEKVRLGTVNLTPGGDTALSSRTSAQKKTEISRRLERLSKDLGTGKLGTTEVKTDGDFAGVLVHNAGGYDPSRMRVFAVAMVRLKDLWIPAPIPASFENTGTGLAADARNKIALLESWMLKAQITEQERLRDESDLRMKREISAAVDPQFLRSNPAKIAEAFLASCAKRDLPAILGFLGGLQPQLPNDWPDRLRSADAAIAAGRKVGWPWRLLMAPEVTRVPVDDGGESSGSLFSFACLDPAGRGLRPSAPAIEILHIELSKNNDGFWKVNLPPSFLLSPGEEEDEAEDDFDKDLLDAFPAGVRKTIPAKPAATMEEATAALDLAFRADSLSGLFSLMDLGGDPGATGRGCALAARSWWLVRNPNAPRMAFPLGFHENGKTGIAAFQFFSPREPAAFDMRTFHFEKTPAGWLLIPGMKLTNNPTEPQIAVRDWADDRLKTWRNTWRPSLLDVCPKLDAIAPGSAPQPTESRALIENWLAATHAGDIPAMLGMIAVVKHQGEAEKTLQSIGYEISTALRDEGKVSVVFTEQGKTWTAIGVKSQSAGSSTYPLYLAVSTPSGPRLLISADLFGDSTSARDKLNEVVLGMMKAFTAPESMEELRAIVARYRASIAK